MNSSENNSIPFLKETKMQLTTHKGAGILQHRRHLTSVAKHSNFQNLPLYSHQMAGTINASKDHIIKGVGLGGGARRDNESPKPQTVNRFHPYTSQIEVYKDL
jgi:hypothetical protein